jgi:hypothetical protein
MLHSRWQPTVSKQAILHVNSNLSGCYAVAAASDKAYVTPSARQIGLHATIGLFDSLWMGGRDAVKPTAQSRSQAPAFRRKWAEGKG